MPDNALPALSLVASPGKRRAILDLAVAADQRGFAGIACPSLGSAMSLSVSLAHVTAHIPFWTSIQPIYFSLPTETAGTASHLQEVSGGRFRLGLGVSHAPVHTRLGVQAGRPLSDMTSYVAAVGIEFPSGMTYSSGGGPSQGARTRASWPSSLSTRARPSTWPCTPPGRVRLYGQTRPMRTDATVPPGRPPHG